MCRIAILLLLSSKCVAVKEGDACTAASENCQSNQADTVDLMQKHVQFSIENSASSDLSRSEILRQHADTQRQKTEFFGKLVEQSNLSNSSKAAHDLFRKFLDENVRSYDSLPGSKGMNASEYLHRLKTFAETLEMIEARNAHERKTNTNPDRAVHGITKYADWTPSEFKALLGKTSRISRAENGHPSARILSTPNASPDGSSPSSLTTPNVSANGSKHAAGNSSTPKGNSSTPKASANDSSLLESSLTCTKNWGSRLPHVRNQGACGNCWTFGTVKTLQAAYMQQHHEDPGELSTQFLVDCMTKTTCDGGVNGCCGGDQISAMEWIIQQGGVPTVEAYGDIYKKNKIMLETGVNSSRLSGGPVSPAVAGDGATFSGNHPTKVYPCKSGINKSVTLLKSPTQMTTESDMAKYVCSSGVLAVAVDAGEGWQTYVKGVMQASSCGTSTNHVVTVIGMDQSKNAWIVQNQWAADWGVKLDGSPYLKDEYANCKSLASDNGCHSKLNPWIKTSCARTCAGIAKPDGGYIYLQYGQNTCGIASEAVAATSTAPGGKPPKDRFKKDGEVPAHFKEDESSSAGGCITGTGPRGCKMKTSNCGRTVEFTFDCGGPSTVYSITMSDNSEYDLSGDCSLKCSNIVVTR